MAVWDFFSSISGVGTIVAVVAALASLTVSLRNRRRQRKMLELYETQYSERAQAILAQLRSAVRDVADCFDTHKTMGLPWILSHLIQIVKHNKDTRPLLDEIAQSSRIISSWFHHYHSRLRRSGDTEELLDELVSLMHATHRLVSSGAMRAFDKTGGLPETVASHYHQFATKYNYFKERVEGLMRTATHDLQRAFPEHFEFMPDLGKTAASS